MASVIPFPKHRARKPSLVSPDFARDMIARNRMRLADPTDRPNWPVRRDMLRFFERDLAVAERNESNVVALRRAE